MNKDEMRKEIAKILGEAIFGDDVAALKHAALKHLDNFNRIKSEINQDDYLDRELKQAGLDENQITAAKDLMLPLTSAMVSFIDELPSIEELLKFKCKEIKTIGRENLPLVVSAALVKGIEYSADTILDRCGMDIEEQENMFIKQSKKEVEKYAEKLGVDKDKITPISFRIAKDPETNKMVDIDIFNIYTGEKLDWLDIKDYLRLAIVKQLKSEGDDEVLELLEKKFGTLIEEEISKEDCKVHSYKFNSEDSEDKVTVSKISEEDNHPEASMDEFFDFFSDILKGMGGIK